jgi:lytic murein transglycosylase
MNMQRQARSWTIAALLLAGASTAQAATCRTTATFERWLDEFKREAASQGISQRAIAAASPDLVYEQRIINIDRGQHIFQQDFLQFSSRLLPASRLQNGVSMIAKYRPVFAKVEQQYGVQAPVIVAFWGLESDFGTNMGNYNALRSLTSLAYDCRRADMFRGHLFDALRMIERGDLTPEEMLGSWAGELGQTQMMPSEYLKFAVDFDGDGKRNLLRSVPDVIASTGNYLVSLGWHPGEPWLREVRVSASVPWQEADLTITHSHAEWAQYGVTLPDGRPLPAGGPPASLVLPMGRFGPAFLAYPNFQAYVKWNGSLVYSLTAAYFATRLTGAPPLQRGTGTVPPALNSAQMMELQRLLARQGYDVGTIDGKLGLASRGAVRKAQVKFGLPADSYPTVELLERLKR